MAGRSRYTDTDKAKVHVALTANDGNVKRTSRESGIPEQTVRDWKKEWETGGVPATVSHALTEAVDEFVGDASRVRDLALRRLEEVLPTETRVRDLGTVVGILTDKIDRARGLGQREKPSSQTNVFIGGGEQMRELFQNYVMGAMSATEERFEDIIDVEVVEQADKALDAPAS